MPNEKPSIMWVLQSRKFWMAAVGLVLVIVTAWGKDPYPVDAVVTAIAAVVAAYVAAVALEDGLTARDAGTTRIQAPAGADVTLTASAPPSKATTTTTVVDTGNTGPQTIATKPVERK